MVSLAPGKGFVNRKPYVYYIFTRIPAQDASRGYFLLKDYLNLVISAFVAPSKTGVWSRFCLLAASCTLGLR